jgi:glycosyltransferase involved in cell wall biosynthesis
MTPAYAPAPLPADPDDVDVDVIVNNHNYARFVSAAVDSALAQTHPRVRVIVVDDGSTDDSRTTLSSYGDTVDLVFKDQAGQASAFNAGVERSTGHVTIFLDADDVLRPEAAATVAAAFAATPTAVRVQYRMEVIDADGDVTGEIKPPAHLPLPSGDLRAAELTFPFDLVSLPTSGNAFRTDALRRLLPIPEPPFARAADWYVVHLVPLLGPVVSLDAVGARYRVHGRNSYEPQAAELDLRHVRQTIAYAAATTRELYRVSADLGLTRPHEEILSVSDLFNRLVSVKLERSLHPVAGDTTPRLLVKGTRASLRRFDVSWPMKILYIASFWILAAAPRRLARPTATVFLFPQRRERVNRLLRRVNRRR